MGCNGKDQASVFRDPSILTPVPIPSLSPSKVLQRESSAEGREGGMSSPTMYEESSLTVGKLAVEWNRQITKAVWSGSLNEMGTTPKMYLSM